VLSTTITDDEVDAKLKSNHFVDELLSFKFDGVSPPGLLPPGLVTVAEPFQETTALLSRILKSAACTYSSNPLPRILLIVHRTYRYVYSVEH
jgi:hypothetical protein